MMGLTEDGQADEALIHDRDRRLGISTPCKRAPVVLAATSLVSLRAAGHGTADRRWQGGLALHDFALFPGHSLIEGAMILAAGAG